MHCLPAAACVLAGAALGDALAVQVNVRQGLTHLHAPLLSRRFKKYAGLDNYPPLQIMFATKGKNKGKLDSHCWYFDAFCYLLQPEFCVLFDAGGCPGGGPAWQVGMARQPTARCSAWWHQPCGQLLPLLLWTSRSSPPLCACHTGTKPLPSALKSVATHFQRYPSVGALTGELTVQRPYRTFLTAVQFCEWKVSHLLQKPIESVCGFLTVLPGAFCAFRWAAVEVRLLVV